MNGPLDPRPFLILASLALTLAAPRPAGAEIPAAAKADPAFALGYLVVTRYPGVKNDGTGDSTAGIQRAIEDGYEHRLAVLFPAGTYQVSDTLKAYKWQLWSPKRREAQVPDHSKHHALVGSRLGERRPVIRLAPSAPRFDDAGKPRPALVFRNFVAQDSAGTERLEPADPLLGDPPHFKDGAAALFEDELRGIDFDCGGHAGAVGVGFAAAQDASIEDVRVAATGAYAGFHGIPGRDMGAANIEVVGGRYGLVTHAAAGNTIVGARFLNQTVSAIKHTDFVPLAMVGFRIVKAKGPVITTASGSATTVGTMSLLDGTIVIGGGGPAIDNASGKSLYLRDVYVKGTSSLVKSGTQPAVTGAGTWARIGEYAYTDQRPADGDYRVDDTTLRAVNLIDGRTSLVPEPSTHVENGAAAPPNLVARHLWSALPSHEGQQDGTAVVTASKYGATPDDATDDRAAIQAAIDDASAAGHGRVFIPRGVFRIGGTLRLHANTRLFGVSRVLTEIGVHDSWRPTTGEATMLQTDDDAEATTSLAFLRITARSKRKGDPTLASGASAYDRFNQLHWRAGRRSTVVGIELRNEWVDGKTPTNPKSIMKVTGHGGGRHYFLSTNQAPANHRDMRGLLVSGTREPLWVYGLNSEMTKRVLQNDLPQIIDANCEIRNAANVRILSMKREGRSPSVVIRDSTNVGLFSGEDNRPVLEQYEALIDVLGKSSKILVALHGARAVAGPPNGTAWVRENLDGQPVARIPWPDFVALYKRGELDDGAMRSDPEVSGLTLSASPSALTLERNTSAASTLTVAPSEGVAGDVTLSASGLPTGVTAVFGPASTSGASSVTFAASPEATPGTFAVTIEATSDGVTVSDEVWVTVPGMAPDPDLAPDADAGDTGADTDTDGDAGSGTDSGTDSVGVTSGGGNEAMESSGCSAAQGTGGAGLGSLLLSLVLAVRHRRVRGTFSSP